MKKNIFSAITAIIYFLVFLGLIGFQLLTPALVMLGCFPVVLGWLVYTAIQTSKYDQQLREKRFMASTL
jgi:hypothetical protein